MCWNSTAPGQLAVQHCPLYIVGFEGHVRIIFQRFSSTRRVAIPFIAEFDRGDPADERDTEREIADSAESFGSPYCGDYVPFRPRISGRSGMVTVGTD